MISIYNHHLNSNVFVLACVMYATFSCLERFVVVTITVTRKYGRTGVVSLAYRTVPTNISSVFYPIGVTRADDQDFMSVNGTITFLENESRCSFTISLYEDSIPETDEYFFVELSAATLISGGQKRPCMLQI